MTTTDAGFVILSTEGAELRLHAPVGGAPTILHWGAPLPGVASTDLRRLGFRQWVFGGANVDVEPTLSNGIGHGFLGAAGFLAHRAGQDWATFFRVVEIDEFAANAVHIRCRDNEAEIEATYTFELAPCGVLEASVHITNNGSAPLTVDWCAPVTMPIDPRMSQLRTFSGRWAGEFQYEDIPFPRGGFIKENRSGRTGHNGFPALIAMTPTTSEASGACAAFHLGWSGNNRIKADRHGDGRSYAQLGELFLPGEMILEKGGSYQSPNLIAAWSGQGLSDLSQRLHSFVRSKRLSNRIHDKPRPVHYNTWEAVYFDHSEQKLRQLADKAAEVGAERFVLDDGWFGGRRGDVAGLGDWQVSRDVYPNGLSGLADHVRSLGMEFGIWFEPEMVNPDSDIYRLHPEWVLRAEGLDQVPFRNQFALDLSRPEVVDYLFASIDQIVTAYGLSYIKWDMNRDIHHPGDARGRAAIHRQTHAVYALMERLRTKHPNLEIESCASGGGRTDYGVLRFTDRLWTSDNNDALERQQIQRGASHFFPLEILGSHVGPKVCHITGRTMDMHFRAASAMFGHMGIEANLFDESEAELAVLKQGIQLYKEHRKLLHTGNCHRLDTGSATNAVMVSSPDASEALLSYAKVSSHVETLPERLFLRGLDAEKIYRIKMVWPPHNPTLTGPSVLDELDLRGEGACLPGEALKTYGIQMPWCFPNVGLIFHIVAQEGEDAGGDDD